jgi:hypothetical protein
MYEVPLHGPGCTCDSSMRCRMPTITVTRRPPGHPQSEQAVKGMVLRICVPPGEPLLEPGTRCDPTDMTLRDYGGADPLLGINAAAAHYMIHLGLPQEQTIRWAGLAASLHPVSLAADLKSRRS